MLLLEDFLKTLPKTKTKPPKDTAKAVYLDIGRETSRVYIVSDQVSYYGKGNSWVEKVALKNGGVTFKWHHKEDEHG